jgi:hypothetical protein
MHPRLFQPIVYLVTMAGCQAQTPDSASVAPLMNVTGCYAAFLAKPATRRRRGMLGLADVTARRRALRRDHHISRDGIVLRVMVAANSLGL